MKRNKNTDHVPMRTCVGCRQRAAKGELVRVVATEERLAWDVDQRLPGRGAYVHRLESCIRRASERGGFARSFRRRVVAPNATEVLQSIDKGQS